MGGNEVFLVGAKREALQDMNFRYKKPLLGNLIGKPDSNKHITY